MFQPDGDQADQADQVPDDDLLARAAAQEPAALAQLYRRYDRFIRTSLHLSGPHAQDDAVVAEVFWAALEQAAATGTRGRTFEASLSLLILAEINKSPVDSDPGRPSPRADQPAQDRLRELLLRLSTKQRRQLWHQLVAAHPAPTSTRTASRTSYGRLRRAYLEECLDEQKGATAEHGPARHLVGYLTGSLRPPAATRTANHLQTCETCQGVIAQVTTEDANFHALDLRRTLLDLAPLLLAGNK